MLLLRNAWSLLFAGGLLGWHLTAAAAEDATEARGEYSWSAKLIEVDEANGTVTVEARLEEPDEVDREALSAGDRVTLAWVGRSWAAGVSDIGTDLELSADRLTLPVEFVSFEMDGHYVRFRVPLPDDAVQSVAALESGDWVTGISPRESRGWNQAVTRLRPYNDV